MDLSIKFLSMKIPHHIHQFVEGRALIVVAGKQNSHIYEAHDGEINLIDTVKVERTDHFTAGGFNKARSQGGMTRSGPVREVQDQIVVSDFIKELKKHLTKVRTDMYSEVFILAPGKSKNAIVEAMTDSMQKKVKEVIEGNYNHSSPLEIIQKIYYRQQGTTSVVDPEARHILEKSEQARQVIRAKS
jgi:hypothetical protein